MSALQLGELPSQNAVTAPLNVEKPEEYRWKPGFSRSGTLLAFGHRIAERTVRNILPRILALGRASLLRRQGMFSLF